MKEHPAIDAGFTYASPFLKRVLKLYGEQFKGQRCLDIPAGNGRNTFLLASYFGQVTAVDINQTYLKAIDRNKKEYGKIGEINTVSADILSSPPPKFKLYKLICNIHLFDSTLISHMIRTIDKGALLLVETPGCQGENFELLPTEEEITEIFSGCEIWVKEFKLCPHRDNVRKTGALKILIRK